MGTYSEKSQKPPLTPFGSKASSLGSPASLVALIQSGEAKSRSDLVRITGLSRSAVTGIVNSLVAVGILSEEGVAGSTGGRPAVALIIPESAGVVIAADFGATHCRWLIARLTGTIVVEEESEVDISQGAETVLAWLLNKMKQELAKLNIGSESVRGIGIGVPGPVEFASGTLISPPIMPGWHNVSVPEIVLKDFPEAIAIVDNDVNMMAIGEYLTTWNKRTSDLLLVKHATGIGAGIIVNGQILHGELGTAGDLGHVAVDSEKQFFCNCGNTNCIEAVVGGLSLAKQLREFGLDVHSAHDVMTAALDGDVRITALLRESGRQLGSVLATVVNILNPGVIVISGTIANAGDALLAGIREVVYSRSTSLATRNLEIVPSSLGNRSGVVGALLSVIGELFSENSIARILDKK